MKLLFAVLTLRHQDLKRFSSDKRNWKFVTPRVGSLDAPHLFTIYLRRQIKINPMKLVIPSQISVNDSNGVSLSQ